MEEKNNNLKYYNLLKECPKEALKEIKGGRLKGMSDINPMWRIMRMTEVFGICGIGWKYEITKQWNEVFGNEIRSYCNINLYVKVDGEWSAPIQGTGGSTFVTKESAGIYVSDENNKMALTDALSVAMKYLGVAANVYWDKGRDFETKYSPTDNAKHIKVDEKVEKNSAKAAGNSPKYEQKNGEDGKEEMTDLEIITYYAKPAIMQANGKEDLMRVYNSYPMLQSNTMFLGLLKQRKEDLGISQFINR